MPQKKILIIDDETDLVTTLADTLTFNGYEVFSAPDGVVGIEKVNECHPDLILLDRMMPKMSGDEVCRKLKKESHTKKIKIVILSAKAQSSDISKTESLGADDYVTKPYDLEELINKINLLTG